MATVGVHPHDADSVSDRVLHEIKVLAHDKRVVAIGEIGLDYHYDFSPRDLQRRVFARQISLARELELPIVVHVREAYEDVVSILKSEHAGDVGGVIHCFSGDLKVAKDCLDMGFYISVGGILTFANSPVSYTHLDVYKRQVLMWRDRPKLKGFLLKNSATSWQDALREMCIRDRYRKWVRQNANIRLILEALLFDLRRRACSEK